LSRELVASDYFAGVEFVDIKTRLSNGAISISDLAFLFYHLDDLVDEDRLKDFGLQVFYAAHTKKHCSHLAGMLAYYSQGFTWDGKETLRHEGPDYLLTKSEAQNVMRWFDTLSRFFCEMDITDNDFVEKAVYIKNEFGKDYDTFSETEDLFTPVVDRLATAKQNLFLWVYSF
jgi:hypothetical protein